MFDVDIIRDNYASMPDEKLMLIAKEDSPDLTDEAFVILKAEFAKRRLDINAYLPSTQEQSGEEPLPELSTSDSNADDSMMGLSYQKMMYDNPEREMKLKESKEAFLANLTQDDIHLLINKSNRSMIINAAIFNIGFAVTMITFINASKGGSYFVAWGAIVFGGIGFFRAYGSRNEYKAALKDIVRKKENNLF